MSNLYLPLTYLNENQEPSLPNNMGKKSVVLTPSLSYFITTLNVVTFPSHTPTLGPDGLRSREDRVVSEVTYLT